MSIGEKRERETKKSERKREKGRRDKRGERGREKENVCFGVGGRRKEKISLHIEPQFEMKILLKINNLRSYNISEILYNRLVRYNISHMS